MNLKYYYSICPELNTDKAIKTNNADTSVETKLVLGSNGEKDNYGFLFFPVDPTKTASDDYYYVVHAQSGYVIAPKKESQENGDRLTLTRFEGSSDQQWSFNFKSSGEANIVSRSTGFVWKVKDGKTADGTNIVIHSPSGNDNSFWEFNQQPDPNDPSESKSIANPDLVGYINNTGQALDDTTNIPKPTEYGYDYIDTSPVLIGECSMPFCLFDVYIADAPSANPYAEDSNFHESITFADQANTTPYYVFQRSQYWQPCGQGKFYINANESLHLDTEYDSGVSDSELNLFSSQTDWALDTDLTIAYGSASLGMSTTINEATLISPSKSGTLYTAQKNTLSLNYDAVDYDRIVYVWQIVDQLQIVDGNGTAVYTLNVQREETYITVYNYK